jgi:hypothetical protein
MTVRRQTSALLMLGALLLGAGCTGGDGLAFSAETDDPLYQQSLQLKKQGRSSEALAGLIKVIERRGEQPSPESHLDAGLIYREHIKDPVEAIHHFKKYLDLAPNSPKASLVRQQIDLARRELFRSMPGRPSDDQATRFGGPDMVERLQREVEDLRAELGRQRGSGPAPFLRTTRGPVEVSEPVPALAMGNVSQLKIVPMPPNLSPPPDTFQAAPSVAGARQSPTKPGAASARGSSAPVAGKRHSVAAGDTLYRVSLKYGVTVEAILAVNRDSLPAGVKTTLRQGMELKIP